MTYAISAIVLAAGTAKRMARPKQLLPLGNSTVLERAVDSILDSRIDEVIVVVGYLASEMANLLANRPVKIVVNPDYHRGMSTSIVSGLSLVSESSKAVMIALADQPYIDSLIVNQLIEAHTTSNKGITLPVYKGKRGHPVIFDIKYKDELRALEGDVGGRQIINKHLEDVLEVAVNNDSVLVDIDTTNMYRRLKNR